MKVGTRIIYTYRNKAYRGTVCTHNEVHNAHNQPLQDQPSTYLIPIHLAGRIFKDESQYYWSTYKEDLVLAPPEARIEGNELILEES